MGKGFLSLTLRTVMSLRYFCSHVNKSNFVTQCFFWQDCSLKPGEENLQFQHPVYATNMLSLSGQRQSLGKHWCFGYASFMAASKLHNLIVFHSILPPSWTRIEKTRYFSQLSLDTQLKSIIFYSSTSSSGHQQGEVKLLALYRLLWKAYVWTV